MYYLRLGFKYNCQYPYSRSSVDTKSFLDTMAGTQEKSSNLIYQLTKYGLRNLQFTNKLLLFVKTQDIGSMILGLYDTSKRISLLTCLLNSSLANCKLNKQGLLFLAERNFVGT